MKPNAHHWWCSLCQALPRLQNTKHPITKQLKAEKNCWLKSFIWLTRMAAKFPAQDAPGRSQLPNRQFYSSWGITPPLKALYPQTVERAVTSRALELGTARGANLIYVPARMDQAKPANCLLYECICLPLTLTFFSQSQCNLRALKRPRPSLQTRLAENLDPALIKCPTQLPLLAIMRHASRCLDRFAPPLQFVL